MQRGSVLPIILVLILVLSVGVGAFFVQYSRTDMTSEAAVQVVKPEATPSAKPDYQEIIDEVIGLTFKMPLNFNLVTETEEEYFKRANGQIRKNFNYYVLYNPAEFAEAFYVLPEAENNLDKAVLTVWVFQNPENLDAEKFYGKYWYYPFVWGDFTAAKNKIAPESIELVDGKEGQFGVVDYRDGKPKFMYLPIRDKNLMLQIQYPDGNLTAKEILQSFKFK